MKLKIHVSVENVDTLPQISRTLIKDANIWMMCSVRGFSPSG